MLEARNPSRLVVALFAVGAMLVPGAGCDSNVCQIGGAPICCDDFQVGATIGLDIAGDNRGAVAAQAIADLAATASQMVADMTVACRNIAQDLDAPKADQDAAEAQQKKAEKLSAWCALAVERVSSYTASGAFSVHFAPPACEISVSALAACQSLCSPDGTCEIAANPPSCVGGSLQVACSGVCAAVAGAPLGCEGSCSGVCDGECEAEGGVDCSGRCEGTCEAGGGANTGIQPDGTCMGTCRGVCTAVAPGATCAGRCMGKCGGSCLGTKEVPVKCDGECKSDYTLLTCIGGRLEGGCPVDAECSANCIANLAATAVCRASPVTVSVSGPADARLRDLKATLQANLGVVLAVAARADLMTGEVGAIVDRMVSYDGIKVVCLPPLARAADTADTNASACTETATTVVDQLSP